MGLLNRLLRKNSFPEYKGQVEFAFTCGGIDYYQFTDFNNMPAMRALRTMVYHEELRMKCTLEFLQLHVKACDNILLADKINIFELKKLNDQLKQRLDIALDHEILMKVASIVYFDKREQVEDYDFAYNAKKIAHWKKHEAEGFFLQQPVQQLFPALKNLNENLQMYIRAVELLNKAHLENLLQHLPKNVTEQLKDKSYFYAAVMPPK